MGWSPAIHNTKCGMHKTEQWQHTQFFYNRAFISQLFQQETSQQAVWSNPNICTYLERQGLPADMTNCQA